MKIEDLISLAQTSELAQLAVKNDPVTIRNFINMGILEIHKRFSLLQQIANLTMASGVDTYTLADSDANVSMNLNGNQYLILEEILDFDQNSIPINKTNVSYSIKNPSYNVIVIPNEILEPGEVLNITYRAAPSFLTNVADAVPLPPQFFEPLLHYVGYKGHGSIQGGKQFENNTHYQRFDKSCDLIKTTGLYTDVSLESNKFINSGYV